MHNIQQAKFMSAHPFHKMILVQSQWNRIVSPPFTLKAWLHSVINTLWSPVQQTCLINPLGQQTPCQVQVSMMFTGLDS